MNEIKDNSIINQKRIQRFKKIQLKSKQLKTF